MENHRAKADYPFLIANRELYNRIPLYIKIQTCEKLRDFHADSKYLDEGFCFIFKNFIMPEMCTELERVIPKIIAIPP